VLVESHLPERAAERVTLNLSAKPSPVVPVSQPRPLRLFPRGRVYFVDSDQARLADKRGGGEMHLTLSHAADLAVTTDEGLLALNAAMERLGDEMPRLADVVECRFFGGFNEEDTARVLGTSLRTVQRDWLKARAWLFRELGGTP